MPSQLHLGEVTLADGLEEPVVANMGLLVSRGGRVAAPQHVGLTAGLGVEVSQGGLPVRNMHTLKCTTLQFPIPWPLALCKKL